jgi:glyoxylase-like metal-dependent hydrolase (beta-lactamase superfamily II)
VSSYAYVADDALVLIDPLAAPSELDHERAGRPTAVLLTCEWHARGTADLARGGAAVFAPAFQIDRIGTPATPYEKAAALPGGLEAHVPGIPEEAALWIPEHHALAVGDVLLGRPEGVRVQPDSWLGGDVSPERFRAGLRPLLELPVELLLLTHGGPVADGRAALAAALDA